jgi:hypothetical protein
MFGRQIPIRPYIPPAPVVPKDVVPNRMSCFVSAYFNKKFVTCSRTACWAMLNYPFYWEMAPNGKPVAYNANSFKIDYTFAGRYIYISDYNHPKTIEHQYLLFNIINEITPCRITDIKGTPYIKFKCLGTYDQSLIVLNFIRNLWHSPFPQYSEKFFEHLRNATQSDPMERLTWANMNAVKETSKSAYNSPGHSNIFTGLRVKTTAQLLAWKGNVISVFLTGR